MSKTILRLNVKELMKAQNDFKISNDTELSRELGISKTQVWRAKLPPVDKRYNAPGNQFIAGVLKVFGGPLEKFFYLEETHTTQK